MRPVGFPIPNYLCRVSGNGRTRLSVRLCYAENETTAREVLESKGFTVHSVESYDFEKKWLKKAKRETAKIVAARSCAAECDFPAHWRELRDLLLDAFHGKCAYCEADFSPVAYGDVEHYRPKAQVDEDPEHRGYYWLAYDPHNLLPACQRCNQEAKQNHFPLAAIGKRAYRPEDPLEIEHPLLLNPQEESHAMHIAYVPSEDNLAPGWAMGRDDIGAATVDIVNLNRWSLVNRRQTMMAQIRLQMKQLIFTEETDLIRKLKERIESGEQEFASAILYEIDTLRKKNLAIFDELPTLSPSPPSVQSRGDDQS